MDHLKVEIQAASASSSPRRKTLRDYGNMSSASVLFVLEGFLRAGAIRVGERGALRALGPGFTAQNVMVEGV